MAKGDMRDRMQRGIQPGLVPVNGMTPVNSMQSAVSPGPGVMEKMPQALPDAPPNMKPPDMSIPAQPILNPGPLQAQGKHPINTNPKRMLRYNSPTGY